MAHFGLPLACALLLCFKPFLPAPWCSPATDYSPKLSTHLGFLSQANHFSYAVNMPRQRGRPRRGSPWTPSRPRAPIPRPGFHFGLGRLSPSQYLLSSHSSHSSHSSQPELEPLATSSRLEGLVLTHRSLGLPSEPILDKASTSRAPPEAPPLPLASVPLLASETFHFHPPLEAPPFPHSISDSIPDKQMQDNMDILYELVFDL